MNVKVQWFDVISWHGFPSRPVLTAQTLMEIHLEGVDDFVGDCLVVGLRPKECKLSFGFGAVLRFIMAV